MKKKMTSRERRAEERRILAEMDAAMAEQTPSESGKTVTAEQVETPKKNRGYDSSMPEQVHCKRCKTLMENGVCPLCGFRIYVPVSEEKRKKIRLWVGAVAIAVFLVLFVILQFSKK